MTGVAVVAVAVAAALLTGLAAPDLETWDHSAEPAWESAPIFSRLRGKKGA